MSVLVNIRLAEFDKVRWQQEARRLGISMTELVKNAVEAQIGKKPLSSADLKVKLAGGTDTVVAPPSYLQDSHQPSRFSPDFKQKGKK